VGHIQHPASLDERPCFERAQLRMLHEFERPLQLAQEVGMRCGL
jgi:hypothetical protein